jgi:hypothetical protein
MIVSSFPSVLKDLQDKQWELLYRGSRDGFGGKNFHEKCDGQSNTITMILTTEGFIFGGFTPIAWDSSNSSKADGSQKSFLFSVKNPHNIEGKKFSLTDSRYAIYCNSSYGPTFGSHAIYIADNCNLNTSSNTYLGHSYANDTGIAGYQFCTGSQSFTVKEIEVFTVHD